MQVTIGPEIPYSDVAVGQTFVLKTASAILLLKGDDGGTKRNVNLASGAITNTITPGELCILSSYKAVPS